MYWSDIPWVYNLYTDDLNASVQPAQQEGLDWEFWQDVCMTGKICIGRGVSMAQLVTIVVFFFTERGGYE
jgi:hypothetical protein